VSAARPAPAGSHGDIAIDRASPVPLYFQLAQHLEAAIQSGVLEAGARLQNEAELAAHLGLSRPTVRSAFQYLANKGMIVRKRGAGTVVATPRIDRDVGLTSLHDDLAAAGRAPVTDVVRNEVDHASDTVARALQLPERALVICLERIRFADGEPIALMHNFLPAALIHLSTGMLAEHGLYELLRASGVRLGSATERISAKNASLSEARALAESRGTALLTMERIAYDEGGRPVEFGQHLYRASRYALTLAMPTAGRSGPAAPPAPVARLTSAGGRA
jgi:DNA-binding GntR family transcriptional regulator